MTAKRVHVTGTVQGVGFRWFVRDAAVAHGVAGWVRNRPDGSVEAELHGSEQDVEAVLDAVSAGPPHSRVQTVSVSEVAVPDTAPDSFEIRATG